MSNGFIYVVDAHFIDKIEKRKKKSWTQVPEHQTTNKQTTILDLLSIRIILFTDDCISEIKHLFSYLRLSNPSYHTVSFVSPLTLIHHCVSVSKDHTWNNITFCFTSGLLCSTCWPPFLFFIFRFMFLFDLIFIGFFVLYCTT